MSLSVRRPPRSQTLLTSSNGEQYHHTHGTTKQPVQFQTNKAEKDRGWGRGNPEDSVDCCWSPTVDTYQTVKEMPECDTPFWVEFLWSQLILILMCDWFKSWCVIDPNPDVWGEWVEVRVRNVKKNDSILESQKKVHRSFIPMTSKQHISKCVFSWETMTTLHPPLRCKSQLERECDPCDHPVTAHRRADVVNILKLDFSVTLVVLTQRNL